MDVNCGGYIQTHGVSAYRQGKITGEDIDRALRNLFAIRMRLGLFNGNPKYNRYGNIGADQVCKKEHQDLALQAAQDGIVLLKNDAGALPLSKSRLSTGFGDPARRSLFDRWTRVSVSSSTSLPATIRARGQSAKVFQST